MHDLTGQTAIVTGATKGIGKAVSMAFLERGATVFAIYGHDEQAAEALTKECSSADDRVHLYRCDISDHEQVNEFYRQFEHLSPQLDILVNNAGIRRDAIMALMKTDDWQKVIDINLGGTFHMTRPAIPLMMQNRYGRIINITSPVAHLGFSGQTNYGASKAGQIGMTRSLARETARKKITVNCVSPGFIDTDFIRDLDPGQLAGYKKMVPMRRFGTPQEVAAAVIFLASREAAYITGSVLEINGGL